MSETETTADSPAPAPKVAPDWPSTVLDKFLKFLGVAPDDPALAEKTSAASSALALALATAESICDRQFFDDGDTVDELYTPGPTRRLLVRRYPMSAIESVTADGQALDPTTWRVHMKRGILWLGGAYGEVTIIYSGGYATFPADLERALFVMASEMYLAELEGQAGLPGPQVQRIMIPDVGRTDFAVDPTSAAKFAAVSPYAAQVLQAYAAESAIGAG